MQLLAWPDADHVHLAAGRKRVHKIDHLHAGELGDKHFSTVHAFDTRDNKTHSLVERDPEAGHPLVGECHFPGLPLLLKEWHDTAAAAHDVAIADAAETCPLGTP